MVLTRRQAQAIIVSLNNLNVNPQVQVMENQPVHIMVSPQVSYMIIPLEVLKTTKNHRVSKFIFRQKGN